MANIDVELHTYNPKAVTATARLVPNLTLPSAFITHRTNKKDYCNGRKYACSVYVEMGDEVNCSI